MLVPHCLILDAPRTTTTVARQEQLGYWPQRTKHNLQNSSLKIGSLLLFSISESNGAFWLVELRSVPSSILKNLTFSGWLTVVHFSLVGCSTKRVFLFQGCECGAHFLYFCGYRRSQPLQSQWVLDASGKIFRSQFGIHVGHFTAHWTYLLLQYRRPIPVLEVWDETRWLVTFGSILTLVFALLCVLAFRAYN